MAHVYQDVLELDVPIEFGRESRVRIIEQVQSQSIAAPQFHKRSCPLH